MRRLDRRRSLLACATLAAMLTAGPAAAGDRDKKGQKADDEVVASMELTGTYTGVLVDPDTVFPRDLTHYITVKLDRLTPRSEVEEMVALLREKGQNALEDELWNKEVGTVQIDQSLGYPIAAALHFDGDRDLGHLVLIIDRPMSIAEVFSASRSTNYPFSIIELDLDEDGEGSGEMMVAAQMRFTGHDLVIRNLAFQPLRILSVDRERSGDRRAAN